MTPATWYLLIWFTPYSMAAFPMPDLAACQHSAKANAINLFDMRIQPLCYNPFTGEKK